mmetsp:Transcript_7431/g.16376  ORF Transcript_7431/g.16376 Transcript_7431/m.16376 type:complete len:750 (-) Transcript_7431:142-2391(-)
MLRLAGADRLPATVVASNLDRAAGWRAAGASSKDQRPLMSAASGSSSSHRRLHISRTTLSGSVVGVALLMRHRYRMRAQRKLRGRAARRARVRPYPDGVYDPDAAAEYFEARPFPVAVRAAELTLAGVGFTSKLLLDWLFGQLDKNEAQRASELTVLITDLGPTFIKIGQALSIRADLLSPGYLKALTELQDRVPPFPTREADEIIEVELGKAVGLLFEDITSEPIASASLGQVYRAKLRDGPEVAVKVQRPGMEERVALDLFLLRAGTGVAKAVTAIIAPFQASQDFVGLIDEWGVGFVGELDYKQEARNAERFLEDLEHTPLAGQVFAPKVVSEASSRKVLTTEWIDGVRLEEAPPQDVTRLCSVAMNTYLTMLLQTGTLHADPHPGNLLCTPDGRLCILDWGCVTELDPGLRIPYIQHITHLVAREYDLVAEDLIKIGFVPEGKEEEFRRAEVVQVLGSVYSQWNAGGGAATIDVNGFLDDLQRLGDQFGGILRVPPYFFYIARAFAVLEGIGLTIDPQYSVLKECMPYISRRLLTDKSPKLTRTLKLFLYGQEGEAVRTERIEELAQNYSSFASTAGSLADSKSIVEDTRQTADVLADLLLRSDSSARGRQELTAVQQVIVDELAKVLGAGGRSILARLGVASKGASSPLLRAASPDEADKRTLEATQRITQIVEPKVREAIESFQSLPPDDQVAVAREVLGKLWENRAGVALVGGQLVAKLAIDGLLRARKELDSSRAKLRQSL